MIAGEKPDAEAIRAFIHELKAEWWLDPWQRHWPGHVFHVTDATNAVSILKRGELVSRTEAIRLGLMTNDNAAPGIIAATEPDILDAVRLYFRPRTPTSFNNEGIRPAHQWIREAHCPIPVMFVLEAAPILTRDGVRFSDGSLARHGQARIGETASFLRSIPFQRVYHDTAFGDMDRDAIIFHRQAEVIVPKRLALGPVLQGVYARSPAELETLATMLDRAEGGLGLNVRTVLRVNARNALFFRQWTYLERVTLVDLDLRLEFNPSTKTPGPFLLAIDVFEGEQDSLVARIEQQAYLANGTSTFRLPPSVPSGPLRVRATLDGMRVYEAVHRRDEGLIRPVR
jgi:hypothetical protein